jgi:hypothetical protein
MDKAMTEAANIERQKRRQAEFVNDEQQRLLEIEDMRLVVKFGEKKRYSDQECQAIYQELVDAGLDDEARRDPDAIEAVFKKLNAADEAGSKAQSLRLNRQPSFNRADDILPLLYLVAQKSGKCRQPPGGTNPGG